MPLYLVAFTEDSGSRYQCHMQAAAVADHIDWAVKKSWGEAAFWAWTPGSDIEGRVYERFSAEHDPLPRTGLTIVQITTGQRRPRVP
jgi:hypothetical protein